VSEALPYQVVITPPFVQQEVYRLGRIHRAAAAETMIRVYVGRGRLASSLDHHHIRISNQRSREGETVTAVGEELQPTFST